MSTTSCPRCSAQVTLPVGVSSDTTVRCPLCHAHYTLADALVNMPPLLEVVEDVGDALPEDWYDAAASDSAGKPLTAIALPDEEASEADTLEMGSLELEGLELAAAEDFDEGSDEKETLVDDLSLLTRESAPVRRAEPAVEDDGALLDFDAPAMPIDDDELTDGELGTAGADDLALDFGGDAMTTEEAEAQTLEFTPNMVESFGEKSDDEVKFDLDSDDDLPADEAATIEFGAPIGDDDPLFGSEEDEVKFDFDPTDDQAETVQFASPTTVTGDEEVEFNFEAPEAESTDEGLRGFEDIRVDASGEAEDIPLDLPMAAVATVPVEEAAAGKKGKKEKQKKEKKPKAENAGDKPRRSLAGMLLGLLLAIPAALYGALWLGPDYDFLSVGKFLPSAMLPAEFKKKPTQVAFAPPSTAPSIPAAAVPAEEPATPSEEPAAAEDAAATEHSAARPVDEPAASPAPEEPPAAEVPAEEMPAPAAEPASEAPTLTPPSEAAAAPALDAATPEADPFSPAATDTPAETPADTTPEADPFAPAATPAATPESDDPFAPAKTDEAPAAEMPAEEKPAADDLFAPETAPAAAEAAAPPALEAPSEPEMPTDPQAPAEEDPFAPAAEEKPADAPAAADPFAPAEDPATPPEATRPTEADPFAPAPADAPAEMPAEADPLAPADKPAEEDVLAPAPEVMPATRPADADPFAPAPADKPAAETLPSPFAPAEVPAATEPAAPAEALGPRHVADVSPAALHGAMQTTFASGQQLMAAEATGDETQLRKARAAFYVNLFGMADAITSAQLGAGGAAVDQQLQTLGPVLRQQLATDPKRLEALKVFGARWLSFPKRTTNGVVVSGTVESAEQVGKLYHTKARLGNAADAPLVTIVTAEKPDVANGDVVLALGSIVDDPQQKISGYEGSEPAVVWSGMTMKVTP